MQVTRRAGVKSFVWMAVVALFLAVFSISSQAKKGRFLEISGCASSVLTRSFYPKCVG